MTHDEIAELLGAYALDAVDDDERATLEAHLPTCARCRAEVQEHREVASLLAHSGGTAPEGIWERIADHLDEPPPGLRLVPLEQPGPAVAAPAARRRFDARVGAAILTAAAVVAAVLGVQIHQQGQRIDELRTALRDPLVPAYQSALETPSSQIIELTSADGEVRLRGAVTDDGTGFLRVSELPRLGDGRTYQLWGAAGDQLVSLGVLGADPEVVTFLAHPYEAFAITEEEEPGVVTSGNSPVVAGSTA